MWWIEVLNKFWMTMAVFKHMGKKIIKSRAACAVFSFLAYWYVRLVAATTKWDIRDINNFYDNLNKYGSVIFIAWHGRVPMIPYFWDKRSILKALVSPHRDGQIIVGLLRRFGIGHIDGSSNERSLSAAVTLLKELQNGTTIAIIPDGPRGPSMTMGLSPVYYAQKTGKPIIGVTYSIADSYVVERSWDRMLLPKPFHKGICAVTKPFFFLVNADKEELEHCRRLIEDELNNLTWQIDKELGMPYVPKGTLPKRKRETHD